ncbi:MAG: hypothetical protein JKY71_01910 [Alphaproteobacteria bacterium]|nr:hypothetical protein [Alphaproteobacteria bacterium]
MSFRPFTFLVTLPAITLLVAGSSLVLAFSRMPPAENIVGMSDMYEVAETEKGIDLNKDGERLAMLDTKS